jgi:hypothetical protein
MKPSVSSDRTKQPRVVERDGRVVISIPMVFKRRGGRKEIIVPKGLEGTASPPSSPALRQLTITIARAHCWNELLDQGRYVSVAQLAEDVGLSRSYVARVLNLTLLAPDIIQAILRGEEPSGLSIGKLRKELPVRWEEQRRLFGV